MTPQSHRLWRIVATGAIAAGVALGAAGIASAASSGSSTTTTTTPMSGTPPAGSGSTTHHPCPAGAMTPSSTAARPAA